MMPDLGALLTLTRSLSSCKEPEAVVGKALDCTLAALHESAGLALIRTSQGALRIAARQGLSPDGESAARTLCRPGGPVVRAIEGRRCHLFAVDSIQPAPGAPPATLGDGVRLFGVIPFLALGEAVGGMLLCLHQEPDKLLWEEGIPYIGATAGLALVETHLKDTLAKHGRLASLGRVAAGVAHDLRNPLTVLGASLELLRYDPHLGEEARTKLDRAQNAFQRVTRLVDGLSGYSKPTRSTVDQVSFSDLFSTVLDLLGAEARSRQIEIAVSTHPPSLAVRGDRGQLLEVLINLLENAMDAIERDGLIALQAEMADGAVRISVRDSGPGIAPDLLDRIFDPFFTTKANGTGLGLAIVREIIERFGGEIRVVSPPGGGTEFRVTLPSS